MVTRNRIIAYTSIHHGNTRRVAEVLADSLEAIAVDASALTARDVDGASLIGFGSGIFFGKHHQAVLACAEKCRNSNDTKAFIFSTAGFPYALARAFGSDFHKDLRRLLVSGGFHIEGEFSCRGHDTYGLLRPIGGIAKGHPNADDIEKAKAFALRLMNPA
ncbi:MAG: flavodoxin family protein [Dehalococcoidia bacterium]|nr:flavodoxin family protein [Dehalococcoidia bacterium]